MKAYELAKTEEEKGLPVEYREVLFGCKFLCSGHWMLLTKNLPNRCGPLKRDG